MLTTAPESNVCVPVSSSCGLLGSFGEQAQPAADGDREDHEAVLVHEVVGHQRVEERATAGDEQRPAVTLPELLNLLDDVAADERAVRPFELAQRRRDDVLGHAVDLVGHRAFSLRPRTGETLVGHAAEQMRLSLEHLAELEVHFLRPHEGPGPAGVRMPRLPTGRLHHAVERHELRHDQFHRSRLSQSDGFR